MKGEYNVRRTEFNLDTFQQILSAMDGYHVLPWRFSPDNTDAQPVTIRPWELPGMPDVTVDDWRYHVGFAIDRGFVECWKPDPHIPRTSNYYGSVNHQADEEIAQEELHVRPPYRGTDATVSSNLAPARLTYAGKEFIDNLNNPSVKERAVEALTRWGIPAMMQVVLEAGKSLLGAEIQAPDPLSALSP
jgi:hypothetical protein